MYLKYFILLISIWTITCQASKRHTKSINSNSKKIDEVTPARYAVNTGLNYDPVVNSPIDAFPEMEYPSSIMDTKPFYLSTSPFSDDVKSSFQSLAAENNKHQAGRNKEKISISSKKIGEKEVLITLKKANNSVDTKTETSPLKQEEYVPEDVKNCNVEQEIKQNVPITPAPEPFEEKDYITEVVTELEGLLTNFTNIETLELNGDKNIDNILETQTPVTVNPDEESAGNSQEFLYAQGPVFVRENNSSDVIEIVQPLNDDITHYCSVSDVEEPVDDAQ